MKQYYLLLKNGHCIDPFNNIDSAMDIAIADGKIAAVAPHIAEEEAEKHIDMSGLLVSPGLIDAHTHCYHSSGLPKVWAGDYSVQPDYYSFRSGVTTMVDTGSAGSYNFGHFKTTVIDRAKTRILAYLNIADYGMTTLMVEQYPDTNDSESFISTCNAYPQDIVGIKIAHYWKKDWKDVEYAQKVQKEVRLPIMVDFGVFKKERPYYTLVSDVLNPGDISTHCFRAPVPVVDENNTVYPFLWKAKKRGIKFDLGHGAGSFVFRNAIPAMEQGFLPDSLSTDIHGLCINGNVYDQTNLLSKIHACGSLSWYDIFRLSTSSPAAYLNRTDIGNMSIGAEADIAVWSLRKGAFRFQDIAGAYIEGDEKLECEMTFRKGEVMWDINARMATHYKHMPKLYGLETWREELVRPPNNT